jgi:hypothetical protein
MDQPATVYEPECSWGHGKRVGLPLQRSDAGHPDQGGARFVLICAVCDAVPLPNGVLLGPPRLLDYVDTIGA